MSGERRWGGWYYVGPVLFVASGLLALALLGAISGLGALVWLALAPFALIPVLFVFGLSILATLSLKNLHETGEPWESVDLLWVLGFFVFQLFGPLAWWLVGRDIRARELEAHRRESTITR